MTVPLSEMLLSRFADFVAARLGLHFPPSRRSDLERGLEAAATELGFADVARCLQWLLTAPLDNRQVEILAGNLTVGETYFFRDRHLFAALEEHILPALLQTRRCGAQRLRLWSVGCCTGEEPYSLAITVHRLLANRDGRQVLILATDINPRFLRKAAAGVFSEWSFRDAPPGLREQYFTRTSAGHYAILPDIQRMVRFAPLNLAADSYPSLWNDTNAMDLIVCRNVLMYFARPTARAVAARLTRCLVPGGWLALGACEATPTADGECVPVYFPHALLYRRAEPSGPARPVAERVRGVPDAASVAASRPETPETPVLPVAASRTPTADRDAAAVGALYDQGRFLEVAQRRLAQERLPPGQMVLLARTLANLGRLAEALEWTDKAIAADRLNPACYYLRASILHELQALDDSARALRQTLFLDQDFVLAHFALGNLAAQQGRPAQGHRHWETALRLLRGCRPDETLPESEGLTAARLSEIITAAMEPEPVS